MRKIIIIIIIILISTLIVVLCLLAKNNRLDEPKNKNLESIPVRTTNASKPIVRSKSLANQVAKQTISSIHTKSKNEKPIIANKPYILECQGGQDRLAELTEKTPYADNDFVIQALVSKDEYPAKFAYALSYTNKIENSISLLIELLDEHPNNKMLNYFLVSKCSEQNSSSLCSKKLIEKSTIVNSNNGALWFQIAGMEAHNKNIPAVITALEQVTTSNDFSQYWAKSIELFDQAYLSIGLENHQLRIAASIGNAAALSLGPVQEIFILCRETAIERADLAQACIDAGSRLAVSSKTQVGQAFGYALQQIVYQALGEEEHRNEIEEIKRSNFELTENNHKATELALFDINLSQYWLEQLKLFGEKESIRLLTEEAIRLSSNPEYSPCPD